MMMMIKNQRKVFSTTITTTRKATTSTIIIIIIIYTITGKKAVKGPPETRVIIGLVQRQKKKFVTVIAGLETVPDLKLKDAAKIFGKKYASGVTINEAPNGAKEVVIQGDVHLVLPQLLISDFKILPSSLFFLEEDQKSIRPYA